MAADGQTLAQPAFERCVRALVDDDGAALRVQGMAELEQPALLAAVGEVLAVVVEQSPRQDVDGRTARLERSAWRRGIDGDQLVWQRRSVRVANRIQMPAIKVQLSGFHGRSYFST